MRLVEGALYHLYHSRHQAVILVPKQALMPACFFCIQDQGTGFLLLFSSSSHKSTRDADVIMSTLVPFKKGYFKHLVLLMNFLHPGVGYTMDSEYSVELLAHITPTDIVRYL